MISEVNLRKEKCRENIKEYFQKSCDFSLLSEVPTEGALWDLKLEVLCKKCNKGFSRTIGMFLSKNSGCPNCPSVSGFTPILPALFYVLSIGDTNIVKFGITNDFKARFSRLKKDNPQVSLTLLGSLFFEKGEHARDLETYIKRIGSVSKDITFSCPTEVIQRKELVTILTGKGFKLDPCIDERYREFQEVVDYKNYYVKYKKFKKCTSEHIKDLAYKHYGLLNSSKTT